MGIVRFDIELDNPANMYRKGSVVSGKVYLDLDSPKSVKGMKLNINGEGTISWTQTRFAFEMKDVHPAETVKEIYIDDEINLLGKDGPTIIPEGHHVYPFSYKLPETIPPSFEDEYGNIEYKVKVTIQRSWFLWNHTETHPFSVEVPVDLNSEYRAAEPINQRISHTFMGCPKPVDLSVSLPVKGYIPRQTIPMIIDIRNGAKVTIKSVYITLLKVGLYHGKAKTRREERVLVEHETLVQNQTNPEIRIQHLLKVPPVKPFYLKNAKLIDVEFLIRVEVRVGGLHKNFEIDVPIIVGNIALLASTIAMAQGVSQQ